MTKIALPFQLPSFGNSSQKNREFLHYAANHVAPMRISAYRVIEKLGGVPVFQNTREYNVEFNVVHGKHFMQIAKALGINVTHMEKARGGYKVYRDGDMSESCAFIKSVTPRGSGVTFYTAVVPMRKVADALFALCYGVEVYPINPKAPAQEPKDTFIQEAMAEAHANYDVPPPPPEGEGDYYYPPMEEEPAEMELPGL